MHAEMWTAYSDLKIQKSYIKYIDFISNNSIILEMVGKYATDTEFKK